MNQNYEDLPYLSRFAGAYIMLLLVVIGAAAVIGVAYAGALIVQTPGATEALGLLLLGLIPVAALIAG